jgi:outer membrane lipoprotein LolB
MRALPACSALLTLLGLLGLAACQSLAPVAVTPWSERRATLQAVGQFACSGQLAAATASEGFSASARWRQQGTVSDLLLRAPLGVGGVHLELDGTELHVSASDGAQLEGAAAQAELVRLLGFEPPLASLRYWLLGVPDPSLAASETLDAAQRLQRLEQGEWRVEYGEYLRSGGQWLPGRVALSRGALRLKLRLSRWQLS